MLGRSEGIPLRDISSLGAMDWGLARLENSSAAVAAVAVAAAVVALWDCFRNFQNMKHPKTQVLALPKPPVRADRSVSSS